jgi:hypothetical protein
MNMGPLCTNTLLAYKALVFHVVLMLLLLLLLLLQLDIITGHIDNWGH